MLNNQHGISLLELIVTIIVLGVGMVGVLPLMLQTVTHSISRSQTLPPHRTSQNWQLQIKLCGPGLNEYRHFFAYALLQNEVFNEMLTQQLTIELPKEVFYQFARIAKMTHQSVESLAIQSISGNLPPTVENAPLEIQASLQAMQTFSIEELLKIAHSQASTTQQQRHLALLERNQKTDSIVFDERQELRELGQAADQLMLKKAYAWALLRAQ